MLEEKKLHTWADAGEFKGKEASHVPSVEVREGNAKIEVAHEMKESHWIQYIWAKDQHGSVIAAAKLTHNDTPILHVELTDDVKATCTASGGARRCRLLPSCDVWRQLRSAMLWRDTVSVMVPRTSFFTT